MERSPIKVPSENDETPVKDETQEVDEETLQVTADSYRNQGNEEFKKGDFLNAIHFYTEGIKVNCNEKQLKAKLYSNRATANFKLGNYHDSLSDAKAATELQPTFLRAIARGASACVELKKFEEAITWCDKGIAVSFEGIFDFNLRTSSLCFGGKMLTC